MNSITIELAAEVRYLPIKTVNDFLDKRRNYETSGGIN